MTSPTTRHRDRVGDPGLARALRRRVRGEVRADALTRSLYATDASIYRLEPLCVVFPESLDDVSAVLDVARAEGVPVLPRGAGTSQCGQSVGHAVVVDTTRTLDRVLEVDPASRTVTVEPGVVLAALNRELAPRGLFFPVDVATADRATLGGMAGNNSGGARSIRYGIMADNVVSIEAELPGGRVVTFDASGRLRGAHPALGRAIASLLREHREELEKRVPRVLRHVAGYNLHRLLSPDASMAELLVGSEGTLAFFRSLTLRLQPIPRHRVLGVCHFRGLIEAMESVQHIARLEPHAIELVDRHLLDLARTNRTYRDTVEAFMAPEGTTALLVELAGDDPEQLSGALDRLEETVKDVAPGATVLRAEDADSQAGIWTLRRASLSIAMSMTGDRKPVSFIEDCAVPLPSLGTWARELEAIFQRHGTPAIWYAHASVGCLHVRPSLSMKDPADVATMRAIAEEAHQVVRRLGGSHSGEHGDGLLRSEFIEPMLGEDLTRAFEALKAAFDPDGLMNPGKIVRPPAMDDRRLFRYPPGYRTRTLPTALDWRPWGGLAGAVEMCNSNGACRKLDPGVMCPSFRVTRDEVDTTRGRAGVLRQALAGDFGPGGIHGSEVAEALDLCVGCKACRRECPTGVDMARMKAEVLHHRHRRTPPAPRTRLFAYLPRYAPLAASMAPALNLRNRLRPLARLTEHALGITAERSLPAWRRDVFRDREAERGASSPERGRVVLFADTFHRYFDPEVLRSAHRVLLARAGKHVVAATPARRNDRPLCCGRTFASAGLLDEARDELERTVAALLPHVDAGSPVVGVEPSCIGALRDEGPGLLGTDAAHRVANHVLLIDELLADRPRPESGERDPDRGTTTKRVHIHGHCHQKALGDPGATARLLAATGRYTPLSVASSCCGMAGSFGYEREHLQTSLAMGELSLFPAVRQAAADEPIVANGFSCRAQILEGTGRTAVHVVRILDPGTQP